uniref:SCP domain-containing protein n=1 Tax=Strongyloides papillosus TaxID=174720 RepID=A0A0N5CG24_STREA
MIFSLNIILYVNLFFLEGICQAPPSSSKKVSSKGSSEENDSNKVKTKSNVLMRVVSWRSKSKISHSKQRSGGEKQRINDIDKPDHLNNQGINKDFHVKDVESTPVKVEDGVKKRLVRGRSTIKRTPSRRPYKGANQQIDSSNNPNHLNYRVINGELYKGNVKESIAKFDKIINRKLNGKSVEDLTKDFNHNDHNDRSFLRARSMYTKKRLGYKNSSPFLQRRYSLSHATTRIKHATINQYIPEIVGFSIEPYLGSPEIYCISNYVWRDVWNGCGYKCFAADHFIQLKFRLIDELNRYRKIHGVEPLLKDLSLYGKAQKHALRLAGLRSLKRDRYDSSNGLVMGIAYYPAASVMMKKWYDEGYKYDYSKNYARPGSQSFTQLIWKKTTHVGIGVATKGYHIWLVLKLFPKGNIYGNCQVPPFTDSKIGVKTLSGESDSNDAITYSGVKIRAKKGRQSFRKTLRRKNSNGTKKQIDGAVNSNHLETQVIDGELHDGSQKQPTSKYDKNVKMRDVKGRSKSVRTRSKQRNVGTNQHMNDTDSSDHLSYRVINGDLHANGMESSPAKIEDVVKRRLVRGRSTIRKSLPRQPSKGRKDQINESNDPNNLDLRVISGKIYYGDIQQSKEKFDKILNSKSKGRSIEDITKVFDHNDHSLHRSMSSRKLSIVDRSLLLSNRRHSLAHATTRIKHPSVHQWIPTITGFSIEPYLGSPEIHCLSYEVWKYVWYRCDYKCFADNHFIELKYRLIEELNKYRKIHNVKPLYKDIGLYEKAHIHAITLAGTRSIKRDRHDKRNGLVMGAAYYPAASVIMKKWYDEGYKYDYSQNYARPGSQSFTQLIWKETTHVGIGVATRGYHIFVVLKLYPKGNVNGKYKSNINKPSKIKKCPNDDSD